MFVFAEVDACAPVRRHNLVGEGSFQCTCACAALWSCIEEIFLKPTGQMMYTTGSYMMCNCAAWTAPVNKCNSLAFHVLGLYLAICSVVLFCRNVSKCEV